jgi:hypothetical protein
MNSSFSNESEAPARTRREPFHETNRTTERGRVPEQSAVMRFGKSGKGVLTREMTRHTSIALP